MKRSGSACTKRITLMFVVAFPMGLSVGGMVGGTAAVILRLQAIDATM
jgi:hypothetical protein